MFYSTGIYLYGAIIRLAGILGNQKAKKWVNGRHQWLKNLPNTQGKKVAWFHCASLGEYDQGLPVMEAWKKQYPDDFILVTFFSPSGYENKADQSIGDATCYLPLDTPANARNFIEHFRPNHAFFIKYEYWINFIKYADQRNCSIYGLSAIFRPSQRFFNWYGGVFRKALHRFDYFFVQNQSSRQLLNSIGITNTTVTGDTRFDRVLERVENHKNQPIIGQWANKEHVFVMGSSWSIDEEMIIPFINNGDIASKVIIAPHEVNEDHIQKIKKQLNVSSERYTEIDESTGIAPSTKVLILDCIGLLASAYQYGKIAYVGGAFKTGLHNILEPAAFGLPVIFGPHYAKFPEAQLFIDEKIGQSVVDSDSFYKAYQHFSANDKITLRVYQFMQENRGATTQIMHHFTQ